MAGPQAGQDEEESAELMYVRCCYCKRWLDVKPGRMERVTHSICDPCLEKQMRELGENAGKGSRTGD